MTAIHGMKEEDERHPLLRRSGDEVVVTNEEMFCDLVYTFALTELSEVSLLELTGWRVGEALIMWLSVWIIWQYTAWATNWFNPEKTLMRVCLLFLMALTLTMSSSIPYAFGNLAGAFGGCHVGIQLGRSAFICSQLKRRHDPVLNHFRTFLWLLVAAGFWIAGACVFHNLRFALWVIGLAIEYVGPFTGFYVPFLGRANLETQWPVNGRYLTERCQSFVIITLGQCLVTSGTSLSKGSLWSSYIMAAYFSTLLAIIAMWWLYFGTTGKDAIHSISCTENQAQLAFLFHYSHAVLILGVLVNAAASQYIIGSGGAPATIGQMIMISIGHIIYLGGSTCYKAIVYRTIPISHLAGIAAIAAVMPLGLRVNKVAQSWLCTFVLFCICAWEHYFPCKKSDWHINTSATS